MGPTNLPVPLTTFIGREHELADLSQLLTTTHLITLTGPGGCGKTRLAVQAAQAASGRYGEGIWLVQLASLHDAALLPAMLAKSLGIPPAPEESVLESLLNNLRSKTLLLVLDNCEHMIAACAELAQQILSRTSSVCILATSREPLALAGETVYPVSGLALPAQGEEWAGRPQDLLQFDAVRLLVERARAVLPNFMLTPVNAASLVQICRRLDGLPLALELASARANVVTFQQIAERLDDRFSLLISSQRGDPDPRHRTLRAAIDWSYDWLPRLEQVMLQRLSVFAGGCSLATAEAICGENGIERERILELLSALVNKSLVAAQTLQASQARYQLLETIRQYAQEKLAASGEGPALRNRHLRGFLSLAETTVARLSGPDQQRWLNRLEVENDNLRAALAWSLESGATEAGLRIAIALYQFWTIRDYVEEGLGWYERLLAYAPAAVSLGVRANALAFASMMAGFRGKTAKQMRYGREAADLAEAAGDEGKAALRWVLAAQASQARAAGDHETVFDLNQREIQLSREIGDRYQLGVSLSTSSFTAMSIGQYETARVWLDEALPLLRDLGDPYRIAMTLNFSGDLARCERDYARAQTDYEQSIAWLRQIGAVRDLASAWHNLGHTCLHLGDVERAHTLFNDSLAAHQSQKNTPGIAESLIGFAALAAVRGLPAAGARLLAAVVAIGGPRTASAWPATRLEYEHYLALVRSSLSETEFETGQAAGRALSLEQAVAYAQNLPLPAAGAPKPGDMGHDLTVREREVAVLIAQGKSNAEIAEALVLSKRTVEKHIANIFSRLGFTNRAQIVRWAIEAGLVKPAS